MRCTAKERESNCRPDKGNKAFSDHGAIEHTAAILLVSHAARHHRRLRGVEAGNRAAGDGNKHERPKRQVTGMQASERHLRNNNRPADVSPQHSAANTDGHKQEGETKDWVDFGYEFINGEHRG